MSNVLVTFVGMGRYDETQYQINGFEIIKTSNVAVALATWLHQAIGLASEWLTTILCQLTKVDPQIRNHRDSLSRQMNAQGKWRLEDPDQQPDLENLDQPILPDFLPKPLTDCWGNIKEKRNDLMHFGQGKDPLKAETFMNFLKDLPEQLKKIFDSLPKS